MNTLETDKLKLELPTQAVRAPKSDRSPQPWIHSPALDGAFILAPALLVTAIVLLFPRAFGADSEIPLWVWATLIIGIDVAHVYSTLFRTYLDSEEFRNRRALYVLVPLLGWVAGVLLYSAGALVFWRVLAYLAVFHFVRQQYGFLMIYARRESDAFRWLDKTTIYLATLYPIVYWHTHPRNFSWFIEGDFVRVPFAVAERGLAVVYALVLAAYASKEIVAWRRSGAFNLPKNLLVLGTALSWFVGIVVCNGDLAFTITNVVSHGVPYMGADLGDETQGGIRASRRAGVRLCAFAEVLLAGVRAGVPWGAVAAGVRRGRFLGRARLARSHAAFRLVCPAAATGGSRHAGVGRALARAAADYALRPGWIHLADSWATFAMETRGAAHLTEVLCKRSEDIF